MDYETEEIPDIIELNQVRIGETGDAVYVSNNQYPYERKTYILKDNDPNNTPILISESWGGAAYLNDDWGMGSREVYAVEELASGNYIIAIKEIFQDEWSGYGEEVSWQTIQTSSTGVLDWNTSSYSQDIAGAEVSFNEDLNFDGAIGVDTSNLTLKTTDNVGEQLALNSSNALFIVTADNDYIQVTEQWSGNSVILDELQDWDYGGSFQREALYVGLDDKGTADTADDRYALAVKETNTNSWDGQTHVDEHWVVYDVQTDGSFDWYGTWGAEIADYENIFGQDIDGDGSLGVDLTNLETITTDTYGVQLKRGSGSLYIVDGDTTLKIKDEWGNPRLEDSNTWEGASYSSTGYAVEKKADGSYALVLKFTETFDDDYFMAGPRCCRYYWWR